MPDAEGNQGVELVAGSYHLVAVDMRVVHNWPVGSQEACNLEVEHRSPVAEDSLGWVVVHNQWGPEAARILREGANNLAQEEHRKDNWEELGVAVDSLHSDGGSGRSVPQHAGHMDVGAVGNPHSDDAYKHRNAHAPHQVPVSDRSPCP
mmetsp:Transcript_47232/g.93988  ORF Transcript_47232/g.93988 Transcript_47232/m.93988 type:complete len:149 (+) Transcript_47232:393-839(+)